MKLEELAKNGIKIIGGMEKDTMVFTNSALVVAGNGFITVDQIFTTDAKLLLAKDAIVTRHAFPFYRGTANEIPYHRELNTQELWQNEASQSTALEMNVMSFGLIQKWLHQDFPEGVRYALLFARERTQDMKYPVVHRVDIGQILRYTPMKS